ncbi:HTH domain-containing protein [Natronorarus salvus]|uniref:HTH domain-containing protein n=1 Tax=Natronorarus salvus TaxID=3117733 RepID=UPI002F2612D9
MVDGPDTTSREREAVLYMRSVAPYGINGIQEETIERLEHLTDDTRLGSVDYEIWGHNIPVDDSTTAIKKVYDEFEEWADEHGYSLAPAFHVRETETIVSERSHTVISVPLLCLGVYDDHGIEAVFPCSDDERTYTLEDGLRALESGDVDSLIERSLTEQEIRSRPHQ